MPRGINTVTKNQLEDGHIRTALNIRMSFGADLKLTTANHANTISGLGVFQPTNGVLSVSEVRDTQDLAASNLTIQLSGCDPSLVNASKGTDLQGTEVNIWLVFLASNGDTQEHLHYFTGYIENTVYTQSAEAITISVACQNFLARLSERKIRRYTDQDQKDVFSTDEGLEFVEQIQEKSLVWGE
jgi:hypothetical protein